MIYGVGTDIIQIDRVQGDVFHRRPVLRAPDWPLLLVRALAM